MTLRDSTEAMKLLSTFYSAGEDLAPGWWVVIEGSNGKREYRHLWQDAHSPEFDDLAAVIANLAPELGLDVALQQAREDAQFVRKTKAIAASHADLGWVS
jgi:hypothetical protein